MGMRGTAAAVPGGAEREAGATAAGGIAKVAVAAQATAVARVEGGATLAMLLVAMLSNTVPEG